MTALPRPDFVVFDLDGTLADSQAGILASFHATLRRLGRQVRDEELRQLIGPPLAESFERLGIATPEIPEVVESYRAHYGEYGVDQSRLYDGIDEVLEALRVEGVRLAVATAKRVDFAVRMLANLEVLELFEVVCGASLDGVRNTKGEIVDDALRQLNPSPLDKGWLVGDRREDVVAALGHSLTAVGVLWGYGSTEELADGGANLLISSPLDLLDLRVV